MNLLASAYTILTFNTLPQIRILDLSKIKVIADDKINVTQKLEFVSEGVENIVGKETNDY